MGSELTSKKVALIIITCFRRPEMLAITLERIINANGAEDNLYLFSVDEDFDPQVHEVIEGFPFEYSIRYNKRRGNGNSSNVLGAYRTAYAYAKKLGMPIIGLIECDLWIAKDYFNFHSRVHKQFPNAFCVSACRNQNIKQQPPSDPAGVYRHDSYQSLGVSFKTEQVVRIALHDNSVYYRNPELYIKSLFRDRNISSIFSEQDGLIQTLIHNEKLQMLYPCAARACHVGYYGSGARKGIVPVGSLREKINALKAMTDAEMNQRTDWKDITFCNFSGYGEIEDFKEYAL